jgi:HK97 family phage major capsid protein
VEGKEFTPQEVIEKFENKISEATKGLVSSDEMTQLKSELSEIKGLAEKDNAEELKLKFVELETAVAGLKELSKETPAKKKSLIDLLKEKANQITDVVKSGKGKVEIALKAQQNPSDIADRDDYATFLPGTIKKPVRATRIIDLFRRVSVSTEYVKYREQNAVTRDAKVVVACATSTSDTKTTWVNRTVQIQKIRDFVDICIDMIDDYSFVASEVEQLVNESVKLKEEAEILLGSGNILSIDGIASEFDPANVLAPFSNAFQSATLAELTAAMKAQIFTFGQENSWDADTIVMNYNDFVKFMHQKNSEGDYLLPNFVMAGDGILNGMKIVTSPLVTANTLYVFDSSKGEILDRQGATLEMSYENNDNFEHEIVTLKVVERLQFHVAQINQDAFMKCTDIATALTAITAP